MMRLACVALVAVAVGPDMVGAFAPASAFAPGLAARPVARVSAARPFAAVGGARRAPRVLDLQATAAIQQDQEPGQLAEWRQNLDLKGWANEARGLEKKYRAMQGEDDVKHMKKMLTWSYVLYAVGLATAGFAQFPWNPISAICLSTAICVRWTMIGHHVCHGGYSAEVGIENRFHRANFARGPVRRFIDWCDWMLPEAWDVEHNYKHHFELGEGSDPDLLERNAHNVRTATRPKAVKYMEMFMLMVMWKWFYYSPNTLKEMYERQEMLATKKGEDTAGINPYKLPPAPGDFGDVTKAATIKYVLAEMLSANFAPAKSLFSVLAPYFTAHFVITPLVFYVLFGQAVAMCAFANLAAAEVLTNLHSFLIVVPNHAGEDVYRFKTAVKVKSDEFYLRAVIGSVNFKTGGNVNDFMHGWLNYQIEHHMFSDMSMLSYQRMAPEMKALCEKYGVPYVQENVFTRLRKTLQIGVGSRSMKVWENGD